jgi:hypothetical protein
MEPLNILSVLVVHMRDLQCIQAICVTILLIASLPVDVFAFWHLPKYYFAIGCFYRKGAKTQRRNFQIIGIHRKAVESHPAPYGEEPGEGLISLKL